METAKNKYENTDKQITLIGQQKAIKWQTFSVNYTTVKCPLKCDGFRHLKVVFHLLMVNVKVNVFLQLFISLQLMKFKLNENVNKNKV